MVITKTVDGDYNELKRENDRHKLVNLFTVFKKISFSQRWSMLKTRLKELQA